ncbi:TPA: DNA cytosine methyltransferase [Photobacterium damselae]|uniref:DNA cytosine methyltransferase n=1 Tax=Photobacterium damselae TaxID=38293 RepID=UPI000D9BC3BF|nr:DNA cytosine methyltransferase [Photobacterium damselae]MBA5682796.1 DNA cytosine methyltransferase [Photobacterium damselae subsp. damselae]NVH50677.1 DNA cytosine methyltransferase [Photobacterium damselae subsp. damselae]NVO74711.1 DNA cytosine methyltransferase [Photobacterium damselae subsp. damselae]NVO82271.1 DNA cytosine methyltransferase [Photobacterium damselae subsp. damselae]SPY30485.1 Modification methylase HaeIII [Photobacterium damselae]
MKYLSFFSGALGLDLGLESEGFEPLLACEVNKHCIATIKKNKPSLPVIGDIRDYSSSQILDIAGIGKTETVDLIVGGPPCQAFSTAGSRKSFEDERGNVFLKYLEIATEISPNYIVIENVRGLLSAPLKHRPHAQRGDDFPCLDSDEQAGGALAYIIKYLESKNYSVSFNLYNSANYGSPQIRERVIIIASKSGGKVPYLEPTHSQNGEFGLPKWRTTYDAIHDLSEDKNKEHLDFPQKRLKYFSVLKPGEYWKHLPLEMQKEAMGNSFYSGGGKTGFYRRVAWHTPSPTLVTSPIMPATSLAHPEELRPLSVAEYARLQQFPDDWEFQGNTLEKYRQIGNAVPGGVGAAIGRLLINHSKNKSVKNYPDFKYSRYKDTDDLSWRKKHMELFK